MSSNKYQIIDKVAKLHSSLSESLKGKHILVRCMVNQQLFTLFSRYSQKRLAPASTTKIFLLHALLAHQVDLETVLKVEESDQSLGSGNNLKVGQHYLIRDLIINLMTASSNTAAKVLARHLKDILGQNYVDYINQYNVTLGLKNTHFVNEHGLAHRQQYASLEDFSILLDSKIQDQKFLNMMNTLSYDFESLEGDKVSIQNTYSDLSVKECIGVKTGTLVPGVFNIVVFFEIKGVKGYIIDFYNENKEDRNQDVKNLLEILKKYHEDLV